MELVISWHCPGIYVEGLKSIGKFSFTTDCVSIELTCSVMEKKWNVK
jgi:hypothetical protein